MNFLEKNLEDIIYETDNKLLRDRGLPIEGKKVRQLKIGNYGVSDIITFKKPDYIPNKYRDLFEDELFIRPEITIYELKKDQIDRSTFFQALRYMKGVKTYIERRGLFDRSFYDTYSETSLHEPLYKIFLIGKSIDTRDDFCFLPSLYEHIQLYTYEYNFDGVKFVNNDNYNLVDSGF